VRDSSRSIGYPRKRISSVTAAATTTSIPLCERERTQRGQRPGGAGQVEDRGCGTRHDAGADRRDESEADAQGDVPPRRASDPDRANRPPLPQEDEADEEARDDPLHRVALPDRRRGESSRLRVAADDAEENEPGDDAETDERRDRDAPSVAPRAGLVGRSGTVDLARSSVSPGRVPGRSCVAPVRSRAHWLRRVVRLTSVVRRALPSVSPSG